MTLLPLQSFHVRERSQVTNTQVVKISASHYPSSRDPSISSNLYRLNFELSRNEKRFQVALPSLVTFSWTDTGVTVPPESWTARLSSLVPDRVSPLQTCRICPRPSMRGKNPAMNMVPQTQMVERTIQAEKNFWEKT
ncbi:hypothetical protein VTK73DRAFT_9736 [Phialemonium thermophilum]|uniref:Uncharacterized protein n=1 Tax=Phialemonium thermophilum TaxID=223376 RepID=A0ABR3W0P9_9PEZI